MGLEINEGKQVADLLNCKLGKFPFVYLGLPIATRNISIDEWEPLCNTVAGRVSLWRGKFMSSGVRLILTNSSLSSLPMFAMELFLLAEGVHMKLDTPHARFFWEGAGTKRRYHMVKWAAICRPKRQGG